MPTPSPAEQSPKAERVLGDLYVKLLPGSKQFLPTFILPALLPICMLGAAYGDQAVVSAASLLPQQLVAQIPMAQQLRYLYTEHTELTSAVICAALALPGALFAFVVMPALDLLLGRDLRVETPEELAAAAQDKSYRGMLYKYTVAHWSVLIAACGLLAGQDIHPLPLLALTLSMGAMGGSLFTVSHELLHGTTGKDRLLANVLLVTVGYMHWTSSHLVHHRKVATLEDPASARLGESLYSFVPRSVIGNVRDALAAEMLRLKLRHYPVASLHNRMLWWTAAPLGLLTAVGYSCGPSAFCFALGQAITSVILLCAVDYVEHYGLQREKTANNRYEKVSVHHSWNANWLFTNSVIFRLQRHADHHLDGSKSFQLLRDAPEAPQLPASYPAMMLLALLPAAFFRVMDPRVRAYTEQLDKRR
ncbi:hypothetical protein WJX72_011589 [[Myrmecia] bisecta]|uniref:Fatty acid desaturase domain-containing protein n=1 Tax=[Myrmecia] bisecta TaxID=41462 RepID=A0AAW1PVB9_9CHLO